jgi:serine/threonine protein phosphatase PrpC
MKIHMISLQGKRDYNEDRLDYIDYPNEVIFGLFDGHGGDFVSEYLKVNTLKEFRECLCKNDINHLVNSTQKTLLKKYSNESGECGSTLLVIRLKKNKKQLEVINLGDSKAMLAYGSKSIDLNPEHKPTDKYEQIRITLEGGEVEYDSSDDVHRVEGYAVSRSMGDTNYPIISQRPYKSLLKIPSNSKFVVLGSDGLWDVMNNKDVYNFIEEKIKKIKNINKFENQKKVSNLAYSLGQHAIKKGSQDNVSVFVILL